MKLQIIIAKAKNRTFFITREINVINGLLFVTDVDGNCSTGKPVQVRNRAARSAKREIKLWKPKRNMDRARGTDTVSK